jgi:hypothetical protein
VSYPAIFLTGSDSNFSYNEYRQGGSILLPSGTFSSSHKERNMNTCNATQAVQPTDEFGSDDLAINDDEYGGADLLDFDPDAEMLRQVMREQEILDHQIKDLEKYDPSKPCSGVGPTVFIGFDSEYVRKNKTTNTILSLQFYLVGECGVHQRVYYPRGNSKSDRPSFKKMIVKLIIEAIEERVILEWPHHIVVCGFFLRTDLQAFGDLATFKLDLDNVAGMAASVKSSVEVRIGENTKNLLRNKYLFANDPAGIFRSLEVKFVDVGGHVAMGTTLAQVGDLLGLPKLELPVGYIKDRMDLFLKGDKQAFEEYGLRDSEIAVRFYLRLLYFAEKQTDKRSLPATASSLAVRMFEKQLEDDDVDFNSAFGVYESATTYWNAEKASVVTKTDKCPVPMRGIFEPFVASCYSGGRNECYAFGPTLVSGTTVYNDFDLAGAYTTGLVDLRYIDFENFKVSLDPQEFVGHVLGFAYVKFEFPKETRFPSLPVRNKDNGLIYPLTGFSYCTAPEIEVALNLGCNIKIMYGVIIPWRGGDDRLFEPFVIRIRKLRSDLVKGSLDELYAKLLGNSLYGKTAQGLKKKTVFEANTMKSVELPHSSLTNAAIAAHTTGFIRAVLSEQIALIPSHRTVISATTDGFITDADESELVLSGPMATRFQTLCERVVPGSKMLERKHKVRQLLAIKTRGQVTAMPFGEEKVVLAKAGVSVPAEYIEKAKQSFLHAPSPLPVGANKDDVKTFDDAWMTNIQNAYMIDLFIHRQPGQKTKTFPFTPFREQWVKDADVVRLERELTLNLEYDMKRRLICPQMISVADGEHVSLSSVPWNTLDECERTRAVFNGWRANRCIKTRDDFEDWEDHFQFVLVRDRFKKDKLKGFGVRSTNKGIADVFRRLFLRAYTKGLCGLTRTMTNVALADWLTDRDYPTTEDDLKNANRFDFVEHAIPATRRVVELAEVLKAEFPGIQICKFLESNHKE